MANHERYLLIHLLFCLVGTSSKVFFTMLAVLGLFICFFGHRFWKTGTGREGE